MISALDRISQAGRANEKAALARLAAAGR